MLFHHKEVSAWPVSVLRWALAIACQQGCCGYWLHSEIGAIYNGSDVWFAIGSRGADGGDLGKAKAHLAAVPSFAGELGPRQQEVQPQDAVANDSEGPAAGQAGLGTAEPDQVVLCNSTMLTVAS